MEDDRWYVGMWVLTSVGDEEKGHKQSDVVNRDGPAEEETVKGQKQDREEIRQEWTKCR